MKILKLLLALMLLACFHSAIATAVSDTTNCLSADCLDGIAKGKAGFLLVAPDRGYAGNQKVSKAFAELDNKHNAQLVFSTDERMEPYLQKSMQKFKKDAVGTVVVLPLFYSMSHPKLVLFRMMLKRLSKDDIEIIFARSFGNTYLAVEMLIERLKAMKSDTKNPLLLLGHGGISDKSFKLIHRDLRRIADFALKDFEDQKIEVVVLPGDERGKNYAEQETKVMASIKNLGEEQGIKKALPFHFGPELDGMMSVNAWMKYKLPKIIQLIEFEDNEVEFFSLWMQREANRYLSTEEAPLGIVFNAHGSDFHWNQGMRDAMDGLAKKYPMEFAFSMADPDDLRQAVARLEKRGAGVIVIVRVFGMRASFRHSVERLIGLDIDAPELCKTEEEDDKHEGELPMRLRTTALVVTEGGLGDSDLFAKAMLEQANKLAVDKAKDTVILVAHGKGSDTANQQWLNVLESLAKKMKAMGGDAFKDINYQTWQEDWEDKRGERIDSVLKRVEEANKNGGNAIVIPARTTGKGRAEQFLKSVRFIGGEGFSQHPLFSKWVEQQLLRGVETMQQTRHVWYPALPRAESGK